MSIHFVCGFIVEERMIPSKVEWMTEPDHIIDETATIQGADIETVYGVCFEWVKKNKLTLQKQNNPKHIIASKLTRFFTHNRNSPREYQITLKQENNDVIINFKIIRLKRIVLNFLWFGARKKTELYIRQANMSCRIK